MWELSLDRSEWQRIILSIIPPAFFLMFLYLFLRDRESTREGGAERERERGRHRIQSRLQAPSCQCGARTHQPWDHDLSPSRTLNWLSHPDAPTPTVSWSRLNYWIKLVLSGYLFFAWACFLRRLYLSSNQSALNFSPYLVESQIWDSSPACFILDRYILDVLRYI